MLSLSEDVPNLSPEKCVRVQALLCPADCLRTPPAIREDLANGPNLDCHSSVLLFFLWVIRSRFWNYFATSVFGWTCFVGHKSCNVDVEDGLLPELVDNPGTTRGTKLSVLHFIVFPSLVNRGF